MTKATAFAIRRLLKFFLHSFLLFLLIQIKTLCHPGLPTHPFFFFIFIHSVVSMSCRDGYETGVLQIAVAGNPFTGSMRHGRKEPSLKGFCMNMWPPSSMSNRLAKFYQVQVAVATTGCWGNQLFLFRIMHGPLNLPPPSYHLMFIRTASACLKSKSMIATIDLQKMVWKYLPLRNESPP